MPEPYGVTETGFSRPTFTELFTRRAAKYRADDVYGPDTDTSVDSVLGRIIYNETQAEFEAWEAVYVAWASGNPANAPAQTLAYIAEYTGTIWRGATKGRVPVTVQLQDGTTIEPGDAAHVVGRPSDRYEYPADATPFENDTGITDTFDLEFEATTAGSVPRANSGTLTVIATPKTGWLSVTNPGDSIPGKDVETPEELRQRREDEIYGLGSANPDAIRARIIQVEDVVSASVLVNSTHLFKNGLTPHTIECVVEGGTDEAIAQAIWDHTSGGVETQGNVLELVTDTSGAEQEIRFSRPTPLAVEVQLTIRSGSGYVGDAAVKSAIADVGNAYNPGDELVFRKVQCAPLHLSGVTDVPEMTWNFAGQTPDQENKQLNARQVATFDTADITLTVVQEL